MPTAVFIDTNIFLYAASDGKLDPEKTRLAQELLNTRPFVVSMQVVQEFHVNATRKIALAISSEHAAGVLEELLSRAVITITSDLFREAVVSQNRYYLSYWDAALVACARAVGCRMFFSEDMGHETIYEGVLVLNPFSENGRFIHQDPSYSW